MVFKHLVRMKNQENFRVRTCQIKIGIYFANWCGVNRVEIGLGNNMRTITLR